MSFTILLANTIKVFRGRESSIRPTGNNTWLTGSVYLVVDFVSETEFAAS